MPTKQTWPVTVFIHKNVGINIFPEYLFIGLYNLQKYPFHISDSWQCTKTKNSWHILYHKSYDERWVHSFIITFHTNVYPIYKRSSLYQQYQQQCGHVLVFFVIPVYHCCSRGCIPGFQVWFYVISVKPAWS